MDDDQTAGPADVEGASISAGWIPLPVTPFDPLVGPLLAHEGFGAAAFGLLADGRHSNERRSVDGGVIFTAFDVALGLASYARPPAQRHATISLTVHFVEPMLPGEFAVIRPEVIRTTRSLTFVRGLMQVEERTIATAEAVFKRLKPPSDDRERRITAEARRRDGDGQGAPEQSRL